MILRLGGSIDDEGNDDGTVEDECDLMQRVWGRRRRVSVVVVGVSDMSVGV